MEEELQSQKGGFFLFLWETVKIIVLAIVIIVPIRYFIAQPFCVKGASMEQNFHDGGYLIVDEISYRFSKPERGEVLIFRFPEDPRQIYIKRVIGLPEETVEIKNNQVIIYGKGGMAGSVLGESEYLDQNQITEGNLKVKLGANEYFVLGDNRLQSSDSRRWGPLNKKFIIGKVFITAWKSDFIFCRLAPLI